MIIYKSSQQIHNLRCFIQNNLIFLLNPNPAVIKITTINKRNNKKVIHTSKMAILRHPLNPINPMKINPH